MKTKITFSFIFLVFVIQSTFPCTTFYLNKDNHFVFGRNYDFYFGDGFIVTNKREVEKIALLSPNEIPAKWISKYGSVTFNQAGMEFPMEGMNEKGLVVAQMMFFETIYPEKDSRPALTELQWIQYQLDNCATVNEVINTDSIVRISNESKAPIHFLVGDRQGNWATIEYINGKMVVFTNENSQVPLLSNNSYEVSKNFLEDYIGFGGVNQITNSSITEIKCNDPVLYTNLAYTIAANRYNNYNDSLSVIQNAFENLECVTKQNYTQWSSVFDISNLKIYYKSLDGKDIKHFNLNELNFDCQSDNVYLDIHKSTPLHTIQQFQVFTSEVNRVYIYNVNQSLKELNIFPIEITKEQMDFQAEYPATFKCY